MEAGSLRSRLLNRFLRRVVKPRSLHRPDIAASRALVDSYVLPARLFRVRAETAQAGSIPGEWVRGRSTDSGTLLYLHGGAFVLCSSATHRPVTSAFARRGFGVFAPDYRLAPEHPYPAALEDCHAAYRGLLADGVDPARLVLAGESAGGGLVLSLLLRLRDEGLPLPAAAAVFSPWSDLSLSGESLVANDALDAMFHAAQAPWLAAQYVGAADPRDPYLSPVFGDYAGLPPLLVQVGQHELILDDARRVAARAEAAGVPVALSVWRDVPHGWQLFFLLPEAKRAIEETDRFFRDAIRDGEARRSDERSRFAAS